MTRPHRLLPALLAALLPLAPSAPAYPPAPHHKIFGTVRDEFGNPLQGPGVVVILEGPGGRQVRTTAGAPLAPGVNYRLAVPMDSGLTLDPYRPNALQKTAPFRIFVRAGNVTYLPLEMRGDFASLGRPGGQTRLDLTLGEDSDGDGLPDAWEWALILAAGGGLTLADIRPEDDFDGDGLSNLAEYLAGTYAFDESDGLSLKLVEARNSRAVMELLAIRGRSYTVHGSVDAVTWQALPFRVAGDAAAGVQRFF
ncbi:MAG TPA: hypothetical protein PKE47_15115, partial [Verrucomicrobiota bacterium]|nr:hypothetical protein [Verrucomicrobiota bacterium]